MLLNAAGVLDEILISVVLCDAIFGTFRVLAHSKRKCLFLTNSLSKIVFEMKKK